MSKESIAHENTFKVISNGKYIVEEFPAEYIALNRELYSEYHTRLQEILSQFAADDVDMKLAHIASYCQVVLAGGYDLESRIKLCKILKDKLVLLREDAKGIILVNLID